MVQPHGVPDDLGRKAIARVGGWLWRHPASFAQPLRSGHFPQRDNAQRNIPGTRPWPWWKPPAGIGRPLAGGGPEQMSTDRATDQIAPRFAE